MLYLLAEIEGQTFALPAHDVASVGDFYSWTGVPGADPSIVGIASRRSQIITLLQIDIAGSLEKNASASYPRYRCKALITSHNGFDYGIIVSGTVDSHMAESDPIRAAQDIDPALAMIVTELISIGGNFAPVLDIRKAIQLITEKSDRQHSLAA
jgi:chemotaxis signal transduction protein